LSFLSKHENNAIVGLILVYSRRRRRHLASISTKFRKFELIAI